MEKVSEGIPTEGIPIEGIESPIDSILDILPNIILIICFVILIVNIILCIKNKCKKELGMSIGFIFLSLCMCFAGKTIIDTTGIYSDITMCFIISFICWCIAIILQIIPLILILKKIKKNKKNTKCQE